MDLERVKSQAREEIRQLEKLIAAIDGMSRSPAKKSARRTVSAATRAKIARSQRARHAAAAKPRKQI